MSSPLLFFIFIIAIDLILKSSKDKKKKEESRQKTTQDLQINPNPRKESTMEKVTPSRNILATLKEEIEKERQKELARRQVSTTQVPDNKAYMNKREMAETMTSGNEYWDQREKDDYNKRNEKPETIQIKDGERDIKKDIIRGIIFSEILSEPKSIQNQRRSM